MLLTILFLSFFALDVSSLSQSSELQAVVDSGKDCGVECHFSDNQNTEVNCCHTGQCHSYLVGEGSPELAVNEEDILVEYLLAKEEHPKDYALRIFRPPIS